MVKELEQQGRVVVWLSSLSDLDDEVRRAYQRYLTPPELQRLGRFVVQPPGDQFLAARALLRTRLALYTSVPALNWQFAENQHGRPYVVEPEEFRHLRFSVSHTHGLVACAFSAMHDIGVDIEDATREVEFREIAASHFAPRELEDMRSRPAEQLRATFYSYWTLKEAYIKGRGMGLALPLDSFWFDLAVEPPVLDCASHCGDDPKAWQFRQMAPTERHRLALGVRAAPTVRLDVGVRWADDGPFAPRARPDSIG
jgi:4'-phosphopantetheinyl transferase